MRLYTLHVPIINLKRVKQSSNRLQCQLAGTTPVKEGFCWPAFFFSVLWGLWHRLWIVSIVLVLMKVMAIFVTVLTGAGEFVGFVICFGISLLLGYMGNDFRRAKLEQQGFKERGIVPARTADAAIRRYVEIRTGDH